MSSVDYVFAIDAASTSIRRTLAEIETWLKIEQYCGRTHDVTCSELNLTYYQVNKNECWKKDGINDPELFASKP